MYWSGIYTLLCDFTMYMYMYMYAYTLNEVKYTYLT